MKMKEESDEKGRIQKSVSFKDTTENMLLGIDIGGSHIGCGFVRDKKVLIWYETKVDPFTLDEQGILTAICNLVFRLKNDYKNGSSVSIQAVGVGCPGQCKDGIFIRASNLPRIFKADLATSIRSHLKLSSDVPVVLLNDADAAVAAEVWGTSFMETHPTAKNVAMITIGTGIGLGLILEGKVYPGSNGLVEGGHMIITPPNDATARTCPCGQQGCVEAYASARVEVAPLDVFGLNTPSSPNKEINGAKEVFQRAKEGDKVAQSVLNETYECLATLCINLCRIIDPDVIIIGGGMALAGDVLLSSVKDYFVRRSWSVMKDSVVLVLGSNATQAGIVGAAMAAQKELESKTIGTKSIAVTSSSSSSSLMKEFPVVEKFPIPPEGDINPYSGLLIMSVGINVAVAASLMANGKVSKLVKNDSNMGMLELAQGSLLLLSQVGLGIWLFSQTRR